MHARFHAPALLRGSLRVDLEADETHHLVHVLRLGVGDEVLAFDGRGYQARARVERVTPRSATLVLLGDSPPAPERRVRVTLAQAVLKSDGMDTAVRDATMIGVASIAPVVTARTAVPRRVVASDRQCARWRRLAVSAAKQCGRAVVPAVGPPAPISEILAAGLPPVRLILVEPSLADSASVDLAGRAREACQSGAVVLVGPEGGWAEAEVALAREAGFVPWSLGPLTLRADVVAFAALAVLYHAWEHVSHAAS